MPEPPSYTWPCPACGRRVPMRSERCHCGATRAGAEARGAPPGAPAVTPPIRLSGWTTASLWRSLPRDVKALAIASGLVLLAGGGFMLFGPAPSNDIPALLGHLDRPLPKPTPAAPPFWLPWWR